jgi:hypothetical protein
MRRSRWVEGSSALDAGEQDVAQGQGQLVGIRAALHRAEDLLHEETRCPPSARGPGPRAARWAARRRDGLELLRDLRAPQPPELDALHRPHALPAGDQRAQRMAAVQLVGAEADDDQHAIGAQRAHEQGHEVERRAIRPVQILDDEHERAVGRDPLDDPHDQLEQARRATLADRAGAGRAVRVEVGQDLRQLGAGGPM